MPEWKASSGKMIADALVRLGHTVEEKPDFLQITYLSGKVLKLPFGKATILEAHKVALWASMAGLNPADLE